MRRALGLPILLLAFAGTFACSDEPAPNENINDAGVPGNPDASEENDSGTINPGDAATIPDAGDSGVVDLCDPLAQTGCDTPPNTKCVIEPDANNAGAHCVPEGANDVSLGGACEGEDCLPGLGCVGTSTAASVCVQLCNINDGTGCESLGDDYDCRLTITGTNYGACMLLPPLCNPLTQDPCPQGQACSTFTRRNNERELRCRDAGPQTEGTPCGSSNGGLQCERGLVCIRDNNTNTASCRRFCDTNDDCTSPASCTGVVSDPPFMFCAG